MVRDRHRTHSQSPGGLPLKRLRHDPMFWAKVTALWHRERVRDEYRGSGYPSHEARKKANQEALEVAKSHGFRGELADLKAQLGELVANEIPDLRRRARKSGLRYWEEVVHDDMVRILQREDASLKVELVAYLANEARARGRFSGHLGFYKLAFILGYVPSMDNLARRNAFLDAVCLVGHDPELCDAKLFKILFRFSREHTLRPFETRLGFSMPAKKRITPRRRSRFGFLRGDRSEPH